MPLGAVLTQWPLCRSGGTVWLEDIAQLAPQETCRCPTPRQGPLSSPCEDVSIGLGQTWEQAGVRENWNCFWFHLQHEALLERVLLRAGFCMVFDFSVLSEEQKGVNACFLKNHRLLLTLEPVP